MAKSSDDALLAEANRVSYRLRSTFFYRKLKEYNTLSLLAQVAALFTVEHLYNWDDKADWGIGEDAFTYISNSDIRLLQVFCHPKALREHKALLAYYRNIAALSQKAVNYLVGKNLSKYEADQTDKYALSAETALLFAQLFNQHISLIVDSSAQSFKLAELQVLLLASTGAQIDGSWRNAIGEEAEKVVQRLLIKEAVERNLLEAFIHTSSVKRSAVKVEAFDKTHAEEQLGSIERYRGIMLTNQTSILFSSEPDITVIGKNGATVAVIEIKGGLDPAGALERYGAAKKSFAQALRETSQIQTIFIASCITPEVHSRISEDQTISYYFNLSEILGETAKYYELVQLIFG